MANAQEQYKKFKEEKNRNETYKQNNKNEKEFFNHLYFFNWFLFIISIFLGYKAYKLYKSGPPIWDSMSEMFGTLTFGFLGKKNTFDTQPPK
tara:strand:+ start:752 stop:1027 length:276 start_codon:yes stop_codon:yes gene_type:complete